ncbi:sugar phosphate isomerase/epimerase family protein [Arcticibacterium luteifluviistationis]|uniref:Xylose isomerase n=1 Tax=Arcticibacterium luteifluviistationis TaxID=1784714 RepID=A0A2Z4GBB8_9BACT|nr:sugar phosphate isomerase/epimerase family protein [Arcticibacterium luteifluviistationis]AWV98340.1 xylose isomerase [Arcticibacterium luteifluviistationis]
MNKKNYSLLVLFTAFTLIFSACNTSTESSEATVTTPDYQISLAQWSLHNAYFGDALNGDWASFGRLLMESPDSLLQGTINPDDFPTLAKSYGVNIIELVNTFYFSKAEDDAYWAAFKQKCDEEGVTVGLIMCDALGNLGDADSVARMKAVENHYNWIKIAKTLGAETIRVNAAGEGTAEEVAAHAVLGLSKLGEYAATQGINVVVENHGGYSSDGSWLAGVMAAVNMENVGTLPDFGNFCIERTADGCANEYDRYKGITELMPYAKGVSAKTHNFDAEGNETESDFSKIFKIIKDSGFKGNIGIEYEGSDLSEDEGIKATKALIEKTLKEI